MLPVFESVSLSLITLRSASLKFGAAMVSMFLTLATPIILLQQTTAEKPHRALRALAAFHIACAR